MDNSLSRLASLDNFSTVYNKVCRAIADHYMEHLIKKGVLLGLSGGADSVMLLYVLLEYRRQTVDFPILAFHVNHGIRGKEADRDEAFSKELCKKLDVEFKSVSIDVPSIAKKEGKGIEECARDLRYSKFGEIIRSRSDVSYIATAHNADDNAETVLLNILRGSGSKGGAGIPPVRDNILRPLIYCNKNEIVSLLCEAEIPYVTDSTNLCSDYRRNFLRNEVLSKLKKEFEDPFEMFSRFSGNLRCDEDFITGEANKFISSHDKILNTDLLKLHKALLKRVLSIITNRSLSLSLFEDICKLLKKDNFQYSISKDISIKCERGIVSVSFKDKVNKDFYYPLSLGVNHFDDFSADIIFSKTKIDETSLNVYSFSIKRDISSAIINGKLFVRVKKDGDTIYYGGITRKLKKLFSDSKLPSHAKERIPVICDESGVLWVPGYGSREDDLSSEKEKLFLALCIKNREETERFYSASEFKS